MPRGYIEVIYSCFFQLSSIDQPIGIFPVAGKDIDIVVRDGQNWIKAQ
jgi:hypothetical protein